MIVWRLTVVLLFALAMSACATFQIGERYDQSIDDDLNALQISAIAFVKEMRMSSGSEAGRYGSEKSVKFYAQSAATLANIRTRSRFLTTRECPLSVETAQPPSTLISSETAFTPQHLAEGQPPTGGNCMVQIIDHLSAEFDLLERRHKSAGIITENRAEIFTDAINDVIEGALSALRAKKLSGE